MRGTFGEILVIHPARMDQREIEMIFQHALDRPGLRALFGRKALVEIEGVFLLDMGANKCRIAEAFFAIVYVRPFAFGRRHRRAPLGAVGHTGHSELHLGLHHEGAGIWKAECGAEGVENDHGRISFLTILSTAILLTTCCQ